MTAADPRGNGHGTDGTDEDVAKLEAEYAIVQERRTRLLEINRLDEEERALKQRVEERTRRFGVVSSTAHRVGSTS